MSGSFLLHEYQRSRERTLQKTPMNSIATYKLQAASLKREEAITNPQPNE